MLNWNQKMGILLWVTNCWGTEGLYQDMVLSVLKLGKSRANWTIDHLHLTDNVVLHLLPATILLLNLPTISTYVVS